MKIILIKIGIFILNTIYFFIKLFPINKNKVTFISRQSNEVSLDFTMIAKELKQQNENIKIVFLCKKLGTSFSEKVKYCFHMVKQMYNIATSKVIILDSYCIPVCVLKQKKKLVVIQIWHALGSLKKFGYSSLDKKDGRNSKLAKAMKMHRNYTYILTSSNLSKKFFKEAFNARDEQMLVMNLPRVDFLKSEKEQEKMRIRFVGVYPETNNEKQNILYCPTNRKGQKIPLENIVKDIPLDKYNFIAKLHDGTEVIYVKGKKIEKTSNFTGMELLHVADYIITDYSAIVYEAAITQKPIYFYTYDYEEYQINRGTYIDYMSEMPGPICKDFKEIIKMIEENKYDKEKEKNFCQKYVKNIEKNATKKLAELVLNNMKD